MALIGEMKFIERMQFFNGQRLAATDLQDLEQFNREMRWLHNQSLHQPGVGNGYAVSGNKGDREVAIQPGYAIDSLGREIVLTKNHVEQVPPVADDGFGNPLSYDLTVAYPDDQQLEETETRDGICLKRGVIRRREEPVFCWVRLGPDPDRLPTDPILKQQLENDLRIRLARADVLNCQLFQPLALVQRRNARPAQQPYVACGRTDTQSWNLETTRLDRIQLRLEVDTIDAAFRLAPCYFAHVVGNRVFGLKSGQVVALDGFAEISKPTQQGFSFSFFIPAALFDFKIPPTGPEEVLKAIRDPKKNAWFVEWMGVER